jgi:P4 family phage/plasmid primase-like protien
MTEYPSLVERRQWMLYDTANDVPRRPGGWDADRERIDWKASWKDPSDWLTYDEASAAAATKDSYGVGFVFCGLDDWMYIDLDGCLREDSGPKDWCPSLDPFIGETVIEVSAGGDGLHIILEKPPGWSLPEWWDDPDFDDREHEGVEAYEERFMAVTGELLFDDRAADHPGSSETPGGAATTEIGALAAAELEEWLATAAEGVTGDDPREGDDTAERSESTTATGGGETDVPRLSVYDVRGVTRANYPEDERNAHPVHGSGTGANFSVDKGGETWRCWHGGHECTGNAYHLIGVDEGIIQCGEWTDRQLDAETWRAIFDAARDRGHDIPERSASAPRSAVTETRERADGGTQAAATDTSTAAADGPDAEDDTTAQEELEKRLRLEVVGRLDPDGDDDDGIDTKVAIDRAARIFDEYLSFVRPRRETRGWRESTYVYIDGEIVGTDADRGIYEPVGEPEIQRLAERNFGAIANDSFVRELTHKLERRNWTRAKKLAPDPERLVVGNGVLDLTTGELDDHTPSEYHRSRIDVEWPDAPGAAACPAIDEFLHDVVADEDVDTLYRFIAHTLYSEYAAEKALMLLGDGANGKSMFLELVEAFIGEFNVSHRSLQDITDYRWAANDLVGRMANIHADMSDQNVDSLKMFKHATGGDTIDADVKFETPVKFTNHATMLFACNDLPVLHDDTRGNWRRWVLVNFPYTFDSEDGSAKAETPKRTLRDELFTDEEFQGLLVRCVEEIQAWRNGRPWFPDVPGWEETRTRMRRASEPVFAFAESCLIEVADSDDGGWIAKDRMRDAYRAFATQEGLPKMGREQLGQELMTLSDYDVSSARRRAGGEQITAYSGVVLNDYAKALLGETSDDAKTQQATIPTQVAVVRTLNDGMKEGMPIDVLLDRMQEQWGIDRGRAEHAVGKCAERGDVIDEKRHGSRWIRSTSR